MRYKFLLLILIPAILLSCKKEAVTTNVPPAPQTPPVPPVVVPAMLLKDIEIPNLPSPFYHFEYNKDGQIIFASFASGLNMYNVLYNGSQITEMRNNTIANNDRLQYVYDKDDRVSAVNYTDPNGLVFTRVNYSYDADKLIRIEWEKLIGADFVVFKTMDMSYYPDGNLLELTQHRILIKDGPEEIIFKETFEEYDNKINVDGFSLIHNDFFDHLVLLPGVHLQKNNPGRVTRTESTSNFTIDYAYEYNDKNFPLAKRGLVTITSGPNQGQTFSTGSSFTYY